MPSLLHPPLIAVRCQSDPKNEGLDPQFWERPTFQWKVLESIPEQDNKKSVVRQVRLRLKLRICDGAERLSTLLVAKRNQTFSDWRWSARWTVWEDGGQFWEKVHQSVPWPTGQRSPLICIVDVYIWSSYGEGACDIVQWKEPCMYIVQWGQKEFITPVSETVALNIENDTELFQGHAKERQHQSAKSNRRWVKYLGSTIYFQPHNTTWEILHVCSYSEHSSSSQVSFKDCLKCMYKSTQVLTGNSFRT